MFVGHAAARARPCARAEGQRDGRAAREHRAGVAGRRKERSAPKGLADLIPGIALEEDYRSGKRGVPALSRPSLAFLSLKAPSLVWSRAPR